MNRNLLIGLVAIALLVIVYALFMRQPQVVDDLVDVGDEIQDDLSDVLSPDQLTVVLSEESDSGESGVVTITEIDGQLVVSLATVGYAEGVEQPAHIHEGVCPDVGAVVYPLTNVVDGMSETTIDATLEDLESQLPLAINVHKSVPEASVYTSCGNIEL